ncbi:uncharacterized protein LOC107428882 isoform X4 [Ziziphus jujuba]|uniref:Uncharacterized protein LOC107428882 isoform X4 n=1 Tax=Ziziphus jujuba TaxID=326968 RepID=A0A6P6GKP4_ZIZJJ|nr:uncharacterized protein LOC107428882 isoform X4 [Ziziphus jujuba]
MATKRRIITCCRVSAAAEGELKLGHREWGTKKTIHLLQFKLTNPLQLHPKTTTFQSGLPSLLAIWVLENPLLDHILLETTGLANPAPLASVLWLDDQLESAVKLDSIITVVDAKNLRFQLDEHRSSSSFAEAYHQIAFADVVILNKVDLVSPEGSGGDLEELEKDIHSINALANIIRTTHCQVDLSKILDCRAYDATHITRLEALLEESHSLSTQKLHDSGVRTLCICETRQVDVDKVRSWLEEILWDKKYGMDVYRCKGVLNVNNSNQLHTLQAVREIYEIVPARDWKKEEKPMNRIVFIGHNLNENILTSSLRACATC